jgi:hypothetical protein
VNVLPPPTVLYRDVAAHGARELSADRQPSPTLIVPAMGAGFELHRERRSRRVGRRNANPVSRTSVRTDAPSGGTRLPRCRPIRELDRVGGEFTV